jgi:hypothetical protein
VIFFVKFKVYLIYNKYVYSATEKIMKEILQPALDDGMKISQKIKINYLQQGHGQAIAFLSVVLPVPGLVQQTRKARIIRVGL